MNRQAPSNKDNFVNNALDDFFCTPAWAFHLFTDSREEESIASVRMRGINPPQGSLFGIMWRA